MNEKDNTVPAEKQSRNGSVIRGDGDGRPRALFLGNSITLHGPKADIGWNGDWGMAASCEENDYVHVFMKAFRGTCPGASWRIGQLAAWERAFWKDGEILSAYEALRKWEPDYVFSVILGANTPVEALREHDFAPYYVKMLDFFDPDRRAKRVVTTMFWPSPAKDEAVRRAASSAGAACVELGDLGDIDSMMALNEFEHRGVAMHPGDMGMRAIAERLAAAAAAPV